MNRKIFEAMRELEKKKSKEALLLVQIGRIVSDTNGEEVSSESSRRMQDEAETTPGASWTAVTERKEKDGWRLEPEGETETPEVIVLWNEAEGVPVNPDGENLHEQAQAKSTTGFFRPIGYCRFELNVWVWRSLLGLISGGRRRLFLTFWKVTRTVFGEQAVFKKTRFC